MLRLFGHFMNHVHNDATKGCAFLAEADRIETELLGERRRAALFNIDINNVFPCVMPLHINLFCVALTISSVLCVSPRLVDPSLLSRLTMPWTA